MDTKTPDGEKHVVDLPLDSVDPSPYQPRRDFSAAALAELADSIRRYGVQQPVVVRRRGARYELVAGERRCRASRLAGKATVPGIVRILSDEDAEQLALIENLLRQDLNPIEEARAYGRLRDRLGSLMAVAAAVSRPLQKVEWTCRFLGLRPEYQDLVVKGQADPWRMNSLARVPSEQQPAVFRKIRSGISTRELDHLVHAIVEMEKQGDLGGVETPEGKRQTRRLMKVIEEIEGAIGRCYSKRDLEMFPWVTAGDLAAPIQHVGLVKAALGRLEVSMRRAQAQRQARETMAS